MFKDKNEAVSYFKMLKKKMISEPDSYMNGKVYERSYGNGREQFDRDSRGNIRVDQGR